MSILEITFVIVGDLYLLALIALITWMVPLAVFDRKWNKAYYLICSYNYWVCTVLNKPELEICPYESLINFEVSIGLKALFCSFWTFYTDIDVIHSLYRYYNSADYIDIKEFMLYKKGNSQNENE